MCVCVCVSKATGFYHFRPLMRSFIKKETTGVMWKALQSVNAQCFINVPIVSVPSGTCNELLHFYAQL